MKFKKDTSGYGHDIKFYESLKIGDYIIIDESKDIDRIILKVVKLEPMKPFPIRCRVVDEFSFSTNRGVIIDNWRFGNSYTKYRKISKEELFVELI